MSKSEYNDIPVSYCDKCLSLKVMNIETEEAKELGVKCYCGDCSSTSILEAHVTVWEELKKSRNIK